MKRRCRYGSLALVIPVLLLSGCLFSTRKLPLPRAPLVVQTATPEELVKQLNQRWSSLDTLNATVEIQATVLKTSEGVARDYTSVRGHILIRKPELMRVLGQVPVLGTRMFDMASDGKNFTLYIPSEDKAIEGSNTLKKRSKSQLENMRPGFFYDAMVVRGLEPDDLYSVTADTETVEDASKKHLLLTPEYVLSVMRHKTGSQELAPMRVVTFHREDLLPYEQDMYDSEGNLETQVLYSRYENFGNNKFPATVTIKRPLEEYQIVLTVEKVVENMPLSDDQFQIQVPDGTKIQSLK